MLTGEPKLVSVDENRRFHILVVDADRQVRDLIAETLNADACEVVFEESVDQVEKHLFQSSSFEVILIDLCSPVEKSLKLIPLIKEKSPKTEIIFISKLAEVDLWIESIQRGAYDYLPKPVDKRELQRIVTHVLEKNRAA